MLVIVGHVIGMTTTRMISGGPRGPREGSEGFGGAQGASRGALVGAQAGPTRALASWASGGHLGLPKA